MTPEERLVELGLDLPPVVAPVAAYVPAVRTGSYVYTAGQLPLRDGALMHTGKVDAEVSPEEAYECARQCALNALAAVRSQVGDLSGPAARVPLGRVASAEEVADAALFLARSTYTTGEVLTIDGGFQLM